MKDNISCFLVIKDNYRRRQNHTERQLSVIKENITMIVFNCFQQNFMFVLCRTNL